MWRMPHSRDRPFRPMTHFDNVIGTHAMAAGITGANTWPR
jgi:hypothetical protein